jgi:hypothetical protein
MPYILWRLLDPAKGLRMPTMKLTRRGQIVFGILLSIAGLALLFGFWWLIDHINWMGDHYCLKSSMECYFPDGVTNITPPTIDTM